jgi:hypothetical protein
MAIDLADVTKLANKLGWSLPDGWEVNAYIELDRDTTPDDADVYTEEDHVAWRAGTWWFVGVRVIVTDHTGREWGEASLWGVEDGTLAGKELNPLTNDDNCPVPDLIAEALGEATRALSDLTTRNPEIRGPKS